ncbi:hypothetical protein EYF80_011021 [Liparis tanakae]|uniref:Uncharacterized protein n=1 Tax=Liparis tanakae TaxID=230148 RepID=A0A4Z2IM39_9TELE|nr:hypothetical protein EYF80_011021 [Liparis tanakae]
MDGFSEEEPKNDKVHTHQNHPDRGGDGTQHQGVEGRVFCNGTESRDILAWASELSAHPRSSEDGFIKRS